MPQNMIHFERAKKLNSLAHEAISSGKHSYAYRLKLLAAKNALYCYEHTKDARWIKLSRLTLNEAKRIKKAFALHVAPKMGSTNREKNLEKIDISSFIVKPQVSLKSIGGLERTKATLLEALEWPLKYPEPMKEFGLGSILSGMLIYGPPGCGKTKLAEAAACDMKVNLLKASPDRITSKWFGESEKIIKKLFEAGRRDKPSIIFIDEIDKIIPRSTNSSVIPRIISIFLTEMDGAGTNNDRMIIIMASNEPWKIHQAILRSGRCDRIIYVPPPDRDARKTIFRIHSASRKLANDLNFNILADLTTSRDGWHYSGSDIENICRTAKRNAFRRRLKGEMNASIDMNCFLTALRINPPSISPKTIARFEEWSKQHASFIDK